jgi:hypothetical protein
MSTLYIREYGRLAIDGAGGVVLIGAEPAIADQVVGIGGGSVQSVAFSATTHFVRVHTDTICNVAFGQNPVAVANGSARLAANQTEFFGVRPGDKIAVIVGS